LIGEISDHFNDVMEEKSMNTKETGSAAQQVGRPVDLAKVAAKEYRKWYFCRRHPIVAFAVLPVLLLMVLCVAAAVATAATCDGFGIQLDPCNLPSFRVAFCGLTLAPTAICAVGFCWWAASCNQHWRWPICSCVILAVLGGPLMYIDVNVQQA